MEINLKNIGYVIHSPFYQGIPLYKKTNGDYADIDGKSDKWLEKVNVKYSSPDNIRRIFITKKGTYIELYKPVVHGTGGLRLHIQYKDYEGKKEKVLAKLANFIENYNSIKDDIIITGNALSGLEEPYACSNVEEVYFDYIGALSNDVIYQTLMLKNETQVANNPVKDLLESALGENFKERFPRLKVVAFVKNLDKIYNEDLNQNADEKARKELDYVWIEDNSTFKKWKEEQRTTISKYRLVKDVKEIPTKYSLKPEIYQYDKDILKDFFEKETKKALVLNNVKIESMVQNANNEKSDIEKYFDELCEKNGERMAFDTFKTFCYGCTKSEQDAELARMSKEGREKYLKYSYIYLNNYLDK